MKVAILLSGGVDSSVALALLKEAGHEVKAFYLKIWLEDELTYLTNCPWEEDLKYVEAVCKQFNVELEIVPMQKQYHDNIVSYTLNEIKHGRTPNPDVMCNNQIKFGAFLDQLELKNSQFGVLDKIASGHYAQIFEENGIFYLKKTPDPIKDQTYFLCRLSQTQLSKLIFPIGHLKKEEVRQLAETFDLPNKNRKDSQGLCFLGKFEFRDFLKHHLGKKKGDFIEFETNKKIADHNGYWFYTIGQRKGLNLSGGPWYVVKKDIGKNIIYISKSYHEEDKKRNEFFAKEMNWFEGHLPKKKDLQVKLRHGEGIYDCKIEEKDDLIHVKLKQNDQGIAAGQFAVFYLPKRKANDDEICLGSGVICSGA